jgi:hypothetical protein
MTNAYLVRCQASHRELTRKFTATVWGIEPAGVDV